MKLTYFGHSCFSVETQGKIVLFDPFITPNPLAAAIRLDSVRADFILISHAHMDHTDDAVALAKQTNALVISNWEIVGWLNRQGVTNTHPMNHGGARDFAFGRVKYVNAVHSSSFPDGTYGGNPGGFIVSNAEGAFYYAGDTALTHDMDFIPHDYKLKFAVLPIGDNFTMGPADAVRAAQLIQCTDIVGVHYDTFPPIQIDRAAAATLFKKSGVMLHLPAIGASLNF